MKYSPLRLVEDLCWLTGITGAIRYHIIRASLRKLTVKILRGELKGFTVSVNADLGKG